MPTEKKTSIFDASALKFSETLAENTAKSLFELVWSLASTYSKKAIDKIKIQSSLNDYKSHYQRRYGEIKVLSMGAPISLDQIYTKVRLIEAHVYARDFDLVKHEENFKRRIRYRTLSDAIFDSFEVVDKYPKLNVLGAPGSGKSTLLKKIGLTILTDENFIAGHNSNISLPVLIELKRFRKGVIDLKLEIQKEFENAGFPEGLEFVEHTLKSGKLLVLLDGLDEVPKSMLDGAITAIRDFSDKYPTNRFITSCRTAFYKNFLHGFADIEIADFDNDQIKIFAGNWFSKKEDLLSGTVLHFTNLLFNPVNAATLELARTPLLLTFLCLSYDEGQQLPINRSSLYRRALSILLERWAAEKRIHNEEIYQNLNSDIEIEMLSEIAAHFYQKEQTMFYADELKEQIRLFLEHTLDIRLPPVSRILEAIEIQQGLFVQRATEIYSFSHLTIQEYLTAFYYYSAAKMPQLISSHIFNEKWREVFLLQAGMPRSEDMLKLMIDYLKRYSREQPVLREAIDWVNRIMKTDISEEDACKRVVLLGFILSYRRDRGAEVISSNSKLVNYTPGLGQLLSSNIFNQFEFPDHVGRRSGPKIIDKLMELTGKRINKAKFVAEIEALIPERPLHTMAPGSRYIFNKKILMIIYRGFNVPTTFDNLRANKYVPINNYFTGLRMLVECRYAALRVSPAIWAEVLNTIVK